MFQALLFTGCTVLILMALIALADSFLKPHWGEKYSFLKALLLVISSVSGGYQIAFLLSWQPLISLLDAAALLSCILFFKRIQIQLKEYARQIWREPKKEGRVLYLLYGFLGYLFILSIFSVPGWNWDSMIYHLMRPFLFLNEGTLFPSHYADIRQAAWPVGADILLYLFTRHGETFGVGFFEYLFFVGTLIGLYQFIKAKADSKSAVTALFIAASMPVLVYCATSDKSDMHATFAFLMMWLLYEDFRQTRRKTDLLLILLALAFGIGCKLSFLVLGPLSIAAFLALEIFEAAPKPRLTGPKIPKLFLFFFSLAFLFLAQTHLFLYNLCVRGDLVGDTELYLTFGNIHENPFFAFVQNFFKYQLTLIDFVLPLSLKGIPFADTCLSLCYNKTIGLLTHDLPWEYHYFPEEMRGSFGPFGIWILFATYGALGKKKCSLVTTFSIVAALWMLYVAYKMPWVPASSIRYLAPTLIVGLAFFSASPRNGWIFRHPLPVRSFCLALLTFSVVANYGKPLIAYDAKAVPWYDYAFSDRRYLYANKYFLDSRMEFFQKEALPGKKILVFAALSDWTFPYYQYAPKARIRLGNYKYRRQLWTDEDLQAFDLIVCNDSPCIQEMNTRGGLQKIWQSTPLNPKEAAFYKRQK